jgi:hypothetical protein
MQDGAGLVRDAAGLPALEEIDAQASFQLGDGVTDGGLRESERLCCPADGARSNDRIENSELPQRPAAVPRYIRCHAWQLNLNL